MKWLHVIPSLDLSAGGTATIVRELVMAQSRCGDSSTVVSLDDLNGENTEFPWVRLGRGWGVYGYSRKLSNWLKLSVGNYDRVVIHGLWQFPSWITRRWALRRGVPYWIFPHGMLDVWFKRTYPIKHLKKSIYWPWGEYPVLRDARAVIYTSETERLQSRKSFALYQAHEKVLPLGISRPPYSSEESQSEFLKRFPHLAGCRFILFMGRIHPKKGLDLLLRVVSSGVLPEDVFLVVAGPFCDSGYESEVHALAGRAQNKNQIHFIGTLEGKVKWGALQGAEAFVLPSHQENFGIAVAEAMSVGCPVLISDQVNLHREVAEAHAGLVESDDESGVRKLLKSWLAMSPENRQEMGGRARECFDRRFEIKQCCVGLDKIVEETLG